MERKIVILGAAHSLTVGAREPDYTPEQLSNFREAIAGICRTHAITGIAEAMSEDGLAYYRKSKTIAHDVADGLKVAHHYIDPTREERIALDIGDGETVAAAQSLNSLQEREISRIYEEKRARFWLDKLEQIDLWPALVICGPNHVEHFGALAAAAGVEVTIAASDFRPLDPS